MDARGRRRVLAMALGLAFAVTAGAASEARADSESACLKRHQYEPCGILTERLVRGALPELGKTELEQQSHTARPREPREGGPARMPTNISSCNYTWPSKMKRAIDMPGGRTMEVPRDAAVRLFGIVEYPDDAEKEFERTHRAPTAEELKRMDDALDRRLEAAQAKGKINDSGRKLGNDLARDATRGMKYTEIEGIGRRARWESKSSQLSVLVDALKFDVQASVSPDEEDNLHAAKAIAVELLQSCR